MTPIQYQGINNRKKRAAVFLECSYVIGDHPHDMKFASNVGATGLYLLTGHGRKHLNKLSNEAEIYRTLNDAANLIINNKQKNKF